MFILPNKLFKKEKNLTLFEKKKKKKKEKQGMSYNHNSQMQSTFLLCQ